MTLEQANLKARQLWGKNAKAYHRKGTVSPCGVGVFGTTITVGKATAQPWGVGKTFEEAFEVAESQTNQLLRVSGGKAKPHLSFGTMGRTPKATPPKPKMSSALTAVDPL